MTLISAPALPLASVQWTLDRPSQANHGLDGKRRGAASPLYGKWTASVTLKVQESEAAFAPIRSFLLRCNGPVDTFRLTATVEPQNSNTGVTVAANAAAGAKSLSLAGYSAALLDGQMVALNGQLLQLTAGQSGSTIAFEPPLRGAATAGTAVETASPTVLVRMTGPDVAWTVSPPARFSSSFDVEEAF